MLHIKKSKISFAGRLIIWAGVFCFSSLANPFIPGIARYYFIEDVKYEYWYSDMATYGTQTFAAMLTWWALRIKFRNEKLIRCLTQWYVDLCVTDLLYIIFGNPYLWEKSKLITYAAATGIFLIVYYFEYISLWHFIWVDKLKNFYHEHFKSKTNGRNS